LKPTLYPNGFPSVYEEIKTFYPVWYWEVREMDAIWKVCGGKLDEIEDGVDAVANSAFVATMSESLLGRMETFLQIPADSTRSLSDRRKLVASYFLGTGHIGAPEIKEIASAFTSGECEVTFENGYVGIRITAELGDTPPEADFYYIMRKKIPAHLGILFNNASRPIIFENEPPELFFHRFIMHSKFNNVQGVCVTLDGSVNLDGSVLLNQTNVDGIDMSRMVFFFGKRGGVLLDGEVLLDGSIKLNQQGGTAGFQNEEALAARLVINNMYLLDGSVPLDGSRYLNADYYKEEL